MAERVFVATGGVTSSTSSIVLGGCARTITGTAPGVLFCVTLQWTTIVVFTLHLAVGSWEVMIAGASVMRCMVLMGVRFITLCCKPFTLVSSHCSVGIGGNGGGGVIMFVICVWRSLRRHFSLVVLPAMLPSDAYSLVSLCRCWCGVSVGNWQCCGNNSVEPDTRYPRVAGT
jgi:hypothetical protein